MLARPSEVRASTITVTSEADDGTGTLRRAILIAVPGDTINFAPGLTTVNLTTAELLINKNLTISGPGANLLTVQRSFFGTIPNFRIFHIAGTQSNNITVTLSGLTITNGNVPAGNGGGGIYNQNSNLTVAGCAISFNASGGGGGIYHTTGTVSITNSTVSGNMATSNNTGGGGIINQGGTVTITNSTISGNTANGSGCVGGGIYNNSNLIFGPALMTITNSTISGNSASRGGGIDQLGGMIVRNTIIAKNTATSDPDFLGLMDSQGFNLIGNTSGAIISGINTGNLLNQDPNLGQLADNGGPTQTHALLPDSAAIDRGHSGGSTTDQRGFTRPVGTAKVSGGDGSDIGAFEVQTFTISPATLPSGMAGTVYNQALSSGGVGATTWSVSAGALPFGITLNSASGLLSGAPTVFGTFNFTVRVTDANSSIGERAYSLTINAPCGTITVTPTTLPNGFVGTAYNATLSASGGTAGFSFSLNSGALPNGVNLSSAGALTGTPTTQGTFNFTIKATDQNGCTSMRSYTVVISGNGLMFYPLPQPVRLMDTRANQGNCDNVSTPIAGGTSLTTLARTTCEGISIPASAQAITGNLTVINQSGQAGYLTVYPDGLSVPLAANMIYTPGAILSNNFTVALSGAGKFNVFGERAIDVVIDVSGYYAPPGAGGLYYHPLSKPIRLLDTRANSGNCDNVSTPIAAGTSLTTLARLTCEGLTIPAAAQAIAGNATVINGSGQTGYLTIYPNGVQAPLAANMVFFPGQILSNAFTVSLDASGRFNIFGEKTIDIVVDVAGYYSAEAVDANGAGLLLTPLARPLRILDTRANQGNCDNVATPIAGGTSIAAAGRLTCESLTIPASAQAILGNVTVINQTSSAGYLTLYPDGVPQPLAANMIYFPSQVLSNAFVVGLNSGTGQYRIFAERTLDAVVDASAYFAP